MTLSGGVKSPPSSLPPSSEPSSTPVNEPAKEAEFQSFLALQELAQEVVHEAETRRAVEVARIEALREAMKDYTPRQYQLHLLELAKETNIIAVVKTGGGKTLIAVLLMKFMLGTVRKREKEAYEAIANHPDTLLELPRRQVCIFLVPTVPLVVQQAEYIQINCPFRVKHLYGAINSDSWKAKEWEDFKLSSDIMVMTPQILVDALNANFIGLPDVALLVFDECHHARRSHPYNLVMEHYRHAKGNLLHQPIPLPKIFGISASPTATNKNDVKQSIAILERNLDAIAFTVPEEDALELDTILPPPKEEVLFYPKGPLWGLPTLFAAFVDAKGYDYPPIRTILVEALSVTDEYGPWWGDRFLTLGLVHVLKVQRRFSYGGYRRRNLAMELQAKIDRNLAYSKLSAAERLQKQQLNRKQQRTRTKSSSSVSSSSSSFSSSTSTPASAADTGTAGATTTTTTTTTTTNDVVMLDSTTNGTAPSSNITTTSSVAASSAEEVECGEKNADVDLNDQGEEDIDELDDNDDNESFDEDETKQHMVTLNDIMSKLQESEKADMSAFIEKLRSIIDVERIIKMYHGLESANVGHGTKRKRPLYDVDNNRHISSTNTATITTAAESLSSSSSSSSISMGDQGENSNPAGSASSSSSLLTSNTQQLLRLPPPPLTSNSTSTTTDDAVECDDATADALVAALPVPFGGSIPDVVKSAIAPKLQILFSILKSYINKPDFCGIIFVEKRSTAEILVQAIRHYKPLAGRIKPGILVGHGQNGSLSRFSGSKMMAKDQERTIKEFRRGAINLLIATKIGEEGLDVQPCMLVVRLTLMQTLINYIQSRGRARHHSSRYIVMLEEGNQVEYSHYLNLRLQEEEMLATLNDRVRMQSEIDDLSLESGYILRPEDVFCHPTSGAKFDVFSATSILHRYCAMTPHDKYCSPRPEFLLHEYDGSVPMYRSTVLLPVTVPGNCRKIEGPSCISKKMARRLVSFAAVKMLFEMGELDSLFRPSYLALDSTGNIKPEITNLSSAVRTVRMGVSDGLQGDWDGQEEFYLSSLRVTVFEDGLKNCSLCPEMDDMDCLMDVVQTQQEQPQQQQQQQQQKKDGDEDAEIVWGESSRETLATTTTSITPVTTTTAATTANTSATSSSSVPLPLFNNALYHYLPKSSIVGKTFDVGILTIGRVQDADKDMLRMVLPFQERLNTTLSLEMVHYAGRGPIKLSQETLRQIRIFHTLSFAALLREEILPSMDFAYMLAPVKNNNCFAGDETDFTRTVPPAELDVTLLKTVYEANCKYEHKSNMNLPLFRALLARYVTAVEDIKKEHGSAKDVEKVSLPRQRISMEKTNRRASSSSSSSSSSNLSLSVKQNQGKETNEEAGGEGNTSNEDQTPMVVDGKEDSSPVDATASSDASTGAINALANTPTQPESIHHQPSPHEALVASLIEKIPKPFYKHAREGSVLELMTDKPGFDAQRDLIDSDMVMIDFYYYARKFVPLEVLDLGPFDTVAPLSLGPNFKHTSVAEFYQKRLNCWETIDPNQRVIRAFHMPQMTLLQRNQANYKTEMARITDLQFPRYRPSRCEIVYLLPQFGRIYPIPRPLLLNDIRHAPILCRQFEHVMITRDVQRQFSLEFVPVIELQTALTAPSAHLPYDYERLELFGDSFLKILFTLHIFAKYPTYHEGRLTSIRYKLEGNRHFTAQASRSCVLPAILTDSLTRLLWHPLIRYVAGTEEEEKKSIEAKIQARKMPNRIGWSSSVDNVEIKDISNTFAQMEVSSDSGGGGDASITTTAAVGGDGDESAAPCIVSSSSAAAVVVAIKDATTDSIPFLSSSSSSLSSFATAPPPSKKKLGHFREISDKTIADCIESLVGAAYLHGSVSGATLAANKLLPGCEFELDWQKGYGEMMRASGYLTNAPVEKLEKFANNRAKLEETIGYKFKNPSLLLEAFTHPTVMFVYQKGGCYQRLEFLGDAVLHFIITRIIFKKYPLLPPGAFSEYRSSLVSNQFLSVVSGRLELPRFMEHYSSLLAPTLAKFQRILKRFLVIFQDRFGDADAVFDYSAQVTGLSTRIVRVEDGDDDEDDHEPEEQTKRKKKNGGGDEGKDGGGHHQGVGRGGGEAPLVPQLAQRTAQEIGEEALQKIKRTGLIPRYTKRIVAKPSYITSRVKSTKFWLDFDDSPKAVADLYESMIGAVFIDSLDLDVVAKVVERTMLNPWMPLMGPPNAAEEHPVNELVNVVNSKQLKCQELKFSCVWDSAEASHICKVLFHDTQLSEAVGDSKRAVKKKAAILGLRYVKANFESLVAACTCPSNGDNSGDGDGGEGLNALIDDD